MLLIIQPEWIHDYKSFQVLFGMFPTEGLTYLSASIVMCTINIILNAFYATSTRYEHFHFILPIQYVQWRNLKKRKSNRFELHSYISHHLYSSFNII
ncbi:hypothetical protein BLA29_004471 [Euroglyphus maynei]|uniref:Uncharacterized protein n=1 Tax=Euroglyphus maynei TaxID=6958 RepID=A0A1Y3BRT2_EURMA|nr:hypothetical protein BLA29_004471 [Euroglyphus maynei]